MSSALRGNGVRQWMSAMRVPAGLAVGAVAGGGYWLAAQLWPSSVAVVLSILASALLTGELRAVAAASRLDVLGQVFYVLIKYNILMALSAAKLPFAAPPNTALWLIMICGYGASRASSVCVMPSRTGPDAAPLSYPDRALALLLGFAPALLLGLPGLIGLAAAVLSVIGLIWYSKVSGESAPHAGDVPAPPLAELCFYLGAQASWSYV